MGLKVKLMIDSEMYKSKPSPYQTAGINKNIVRYPRTIDAKELAEEVLKGKTFLCSFLFDNEGLPKRTKQYWNSQQVIALDFDNERYLTNDKGERVRGDDNKYIKVKDVTTTIEKINSDEFIQNNAAFAYKTFSYTDDHPKFRVVFILDRPIHNRTMMESMIKELLEFYPDADTQCSDGTRLFYGGKEIIPINDYKNTLPLTTPLGEYIRVNYNIYPTKGSSISTDSKVVRLDDYKFNKVDNRTSITKSDYIPVNNTYHKTSNVQLIIDKNIPELQKRINPKPTIVYTNSQVNEYLCKCDLKEFLGTTSNHIYDIFHDENSPSGSIFQTNTGEGNWLYKCHSTSFPFVGSIIQIVQKLHNSKPLDAKLFLMELYNIQIVESDIQKRVKAEIDEYKIMLQSSTLPDIYPNFYKLFKNNGFLEDFYILLDLVKENISVDDDNPRALFWQSTEKIAERMRRSTTNANMRMNFYSFFELIYKLDKKEIPSNIYKMLKDRKKLKQYKYMASTYEIKEQTLDFFDDLEKRCEIWVSKGLTTKTMNYEGILRNFGQEEANRVFPQQKNQKTEPLNDEIVFLIEKSTMDLIQAKGWTYEREILDNVKLYYKGQQKHKEAQMKRCLGDLLDKYGLHRVGCTKVLKVELNITEEQLPAASFPKLIVPSK